MQPKRNLPYELFETLQSFMDALWEDYQDDILEETKAQDVRPDPHEETCDPNFNDDCIPF